MSRRVTLKDIARSTGVHVSTVSRALDPNRDAPLSENVIAKVREAAAKLGYRPNRIAYSLRTNRTLTIGVVMPDITNPIFPPIVRGIESVMEPLGYASILVNTDGQKKREQQLIGILQDRGVDGIIHMAALLDDPSIAKVTEEALPVITLNRRVEQPDTPYIINDEEGGIRQVFAHLRALGHARIAHIAGPAETSTGQLRLRAFNHFAREAGLDPAHTPTALASRFDEDEGKRLALEIMRERPETTALLCANDLLALGAISALRSLNMRCPEDVSVTGFNDMPFLDRIPPGLTTIRVPQFEGGAAAGKHMAAIMAGKGPELPRETILPVTLIKRASTAPPRGS